nr:acyl-CoA oxidase [Myxococcota bacterium]
MQDRLALLGDPQLRPFLPLLYIAWADGDLEPDQRAVIASRIEAQPWLRPAARDAVERWLDPAHPPSPHELAGVRASLERAVGTLDASARRSLATMAEALAVDGEKSESA